MTLRITLKRGTVVLATLLMLVVIVVAKNPTTANAAKELPYLIKVNKQMNTITIYEKDSKGAYTKPVKAFVCSTGNATPIGSFNTRQKYRWKLMIEEVWSQYATRIVGSILFHSVYYYDPRDPSTLSTKQYNRLGTTASHGCVRLTCADSKWIYDNCPIGTKVVIYNSSKPGPLGKPNAIKIPSWPRWDPTDTNTENPYNKKSPKITGATNKSVAYLSKVDLKKGVKAYNTTGYDATKLLTVSGKVNTKVPGKYKVTYQIIDEIGRKAKKTVTYTVLEDKRKATLHNVTDRYYGMTYAKTDIRLLAMGKVYASFANKKLTQSQAPIRYSYKLVKSTSTYKRYKITYSVVAPKTKVKTTKSCYIIIDYKAPTISGDSKIYLTPTEYTTLKKDIAKGKFAYIKVSDNYFKKTKPKVTYSLKATSEKYVYNLTYTAIDLAGNASSKTVTVYVMKRAKWIGTNFYLDNESLLTKEEMLKHIGLTVNGVEWIDKFKQMIQVTFIPSLDTKYQKENMDCYKVTYTLKLSNTYTKQKVLYCYVKKPVPPVQPEAQEVPNTSEVPEV